MAADGYGFIFGVANLVVNTLRFLVLAVVSYRDDKRQISQTKKQEDELPQVKVEEEDKPSSEMSAGEAEPDSLHEG